MDEFFKEVKLVLGEDIESVTYTISIYAGVLQSSVYLREINSQPYLKKVSEDRLNEIREDITKIEKDYKLKYIK